MGPPCRGITEGDSDASGFRCQVLAVPLCDLHTDVKAQMSCLRPASGANINSQWRTVQLPEGTRHILVVGAAVDLNIAASVYWHGVGTIEGNEPKLTVQDTNELIVFPRLCWAVLMCPMDVRCDELTL